MAYVVSNQNLKRNIFFNWDYKVVLLIQEKQFKGKNVVIKTKN